MGTESVFADIASAVVAQAALWVMDLSPLAMLWIGLAVGLAVLGAVIGIIKGGA